MLLDWIVSEYEKTTINKRKCPRMGLANGDKAFKMAIELHSIMSHLICSEWSGDWSRMNFCIVGLHYSNREWERWQYKFSGKIIPIENFVKGYIRGFCVDFMLRDLAVLANTLNGEAWWCLLAGKDLRCFYRIHLCICAHRTVVGKNLFLKKWAMF